MVHYQGLTKVREASLLLPEVLQVFGFTLDIAMVLLIESVILYAEILYSLAAIEAAVTTPLNPLVIIKFTVASMLFYRALFLRGKRDEFTRQVDLMCRATSLWV